jgi:hypothetical protein
LGNDRPADEGSLNGWWWRPGIGSRLRSIETVESSLLHRSRRFGRDTGESTSRESNSSRSDELSAGRVWALVGALVWDGDEQGQGEITLGLVCEASGEHGAVASGRSGESLSSSEVECCDAWSEGKITLLDREGDCSGHRGGDERGWQGSMKVTIGGAGSAIV